jgi:hypothetical protein
MVKVLDTNSESPWFGKVVDHKVSVCMATFPPRADYLASSVSSIIGQCDKLYIYFNEYSEKDVPEWVKGSHRIEWTCSEMNDGKDLGDVGKFYFCKDIDGYIFTCDDDIGYHVHYVHNALRQLIELEKHQPSVITHHGGKFKTLNPKSFHASLDKSLFINGNKQTRRVHVGGTGCMGFHSSTMQPTVEMFEHINMADGFIARHCNNEGIPIYVVEHGRGDSKIFPNRQESIWTATSKKASNKRDRSSELNMLAQTTNWVSF